MENRTSYLKTTTIPRPLAQRQISIGRNPQDLMTLEWRHCVASKLRDPITHGHSVISRKNGVNERRMSGCVANECVRNLNPAQIEGKGGELVIFSNNY